jgi:large subunit ribosomal protein L4
MAAKVLTVEAAKAARIEVVENGRYTQVVHDTVVALRANRRSGTASVKTKATVSGSGSKPWRQKGTGRARAGYRSSPVWVGGGVVFGPHPRDYSKKVSKANKRLALRKALSERIKSGDVLVVDTFVVAQPKTKQFVAALAALTSEARTLVISAAFDDTTYLAGRNVGPTLLMTAAEVNTEHLLNYRKIVLTEDGLAQLADRIAKK